MEGFPLTVTAFVECREVIFPGHLGFSLQGWRFKKEEMERENGNGEGRETDLGMGRLMFVSFSWVGDLPPVNAEKEPARAKHDVIFCI